MKDKALDAANEKLEVLIRLVALGVCGERTQREKIALLSSAGLQPKLIAELLGTTGNTVRVSLAGIRKDAKKKRAAKGTDDSAGNE